MGWSIIEGLKKGSDPLKVETEDNLRENEVPLWKAVLNLVVGMILLIISSRALVWGAVKIARGSE